MDAIHSKFLVHWTGKQIATGTELSPDQICLYVAHLRKILTEGLYVRCPSADEARRERTFGNTWGEEHWFDICFACLCFTEIRLTQAEAHAKRYGKLGIGFSRDFVMSRGGNPAFYIQNGCQGIAAEMFDRISGYLKERCQAGDAAAKVQKRHLEVLMAFTKRMGEQDAPELTYYDEMEWRILHSDGGEKAGHFIPTAEGLWLMPFQLSDVKLIVFPTADVKRCALQDPVLKDLLSQLPSPMLLTLDDCAHF